MMFQLLTEFLVIFKQSQTLDIVVLYIVVVTKKPPVCQIMHFSLYCINGAIEADTSIGKIPMMHF